MKHFRDILRLRHELGLTQREISRSLGIGLGTVSEYLRRAEQAGLSWPEAAALDEPEIEARLFPRDPDQDPPRTPPDLPAIHRELKRVGVTLQLLWVEYIQANPGGYRYSQFCELYRRFAKKLGPVMRQVHKAGEKTFVDFSGKKPEIVDPMTGVVTSVDLFVGAMGASHYFYAEATPDQTLGSWIGAHVRMVEWFGAAPQVFVPDNLKSGITDACRYEPGVNRSYEEFARYYGAVVIPARVVRPRDKAKVENAVLLAQRWILAALRNRTFFSLCDLNDAIRQLLPILNARLLQKLGVSRRELFDRVDRPAMNPLPPSRYELATWKPVTVNIDYHVEVDRNFYSVPHALLREKVEARVTQAVVEIIFRSSRVTSHRRLTGRGLYATKPEHMPASHRAHAEWTPSRLVSWASSNGVATGQLVAGILESRPHPEQGYRACLGIMRLGRKHGAERLEAACERAVRLAAPSYRTVYNILAAGADRLPLNEEVTAPAPIHENIRGAAYYEEDPC
ncbi:MAG TPA: IS21 family transposase [Candidatus Eisenbacteria bacterium]